MRVVCVCVCFRCRAVQGAADLMGACNVLHKPGGSRDLVGAGNWSRGAALNIEDRGNRLPNNSSKGGGGGGSITVSKSKYCRWTWCGNQHCSKFSVQLINEFVLKIPKTK